MKKKQSLLFRDKKGKFWVQGEKEKERDNRRRES